MPNLNASTAPIDFTTAFGRLLRDGLLRDALAANPWAVVEQLAVREADCPALLGLVPADLEYQAEVLLRKRLTVVRHIIPESLSRLQEAAWPLFHAYVRICWPAGENPGPRDAYDFATFLKQHRPDSLCDREWNRLEFFVKRTWLAIHRVRLPREGENKRRNRHALQVLFRRGREGKRGHEWLFYFQI